MYEHSELRHGLACAMDASDASVLGAHARTRSRIAACAHALAHEAVLLAHQTTSAHLAGRHLFEIVLMCVPALRDT